MRGILFFVCLIALFVATLVVLFMAIRAEEKNEQKRREKVFRCRQAVKNNSCPKDCSNCEWGGYDT